DGAGAGVAGWRGAADQKLLAIAQRPARFQRRQPADDADRTAGGALPAYAGAGAISPGAARGGQFAAGRAGGAGQRTADERRLADARLSGRRAAVVRW